MQWRGIELKDTTRFLPLKEHRGAYFVEYNVPNENYLFAVVQLIYVKALPIPDVARAMESEIEHWGRRFPVPVMVTAFDDTGSVITLTPTMPADHAIGWIDKSDKVVIHWRLVKNDEIPGEPFTLDRLFATYPEVPREVQTAEDKRKHFEDTRRRNRTLVYVLIVWFGAIPIAIALITQFVFWAGWIATLISVGNGVREIAKLKGWIKPSKRQKKKDEEERRMKHHHYWCERNPAGFARLKSEAIDGEERERIRKEAAEVKNRN